MNHQDNGLYLSTFFIEACVHKFKSHKRHWWEAQQGREGETCCLLWDLLDVVETDKQIVSKEGIQVMAWWLYDRKYFDPERTVYFDVKLLRDYQSFDYIWELRNLIQENVYIILYAYLHSLSMGVNGSLFVDQSIKSGEILGTLHGQHELTGKATRLQEILESYLELNPKAAKPVAGSQSP